VIRIDDCLARFREALIAGWPVVEPIARDIGISGEYWLDSWKQSQWEFLVEMPLFWGSDRFLVPYDSGADLDGPSSRVHRPDAEATHDVRCTVDPGAIDLLTGDTITTEGKTVSFIRFAALTNGWHHQAPPFDCVLLEVDGQETLVRFGSARWEVAQVT
jgi:hypothetical protein